MLLILIFIFSLRFLYIESDLAVPWGVLNYQPIDEGIYANLALNKINYGVLNPNLAIDPQYKYLMQPHVITNIFGNTIIYIGLKLFGDNYLGFRIGAIMIGLLSSILLYFTLCNIQKRITQKQLSGKSYLLIATTILLFSFNFVFYNASRLNEPTLYRMFCLVMILFIFSSFKMCDSLKAFFMVFVSVSSIFLVYVTNVFILLAFIMLLFVWFWQKNLKTAKKYLFFGMLGGVCAYLISLCYYIYYWDTTPIKNLFACINSFSNTGGYTIATSNYLTNVGAFFSSNILLYNPLLIWGMVWGFYFILDKKNKTDDLIILSLVMIIAMFLQTLFSEDYIVRKALIILPVFVIILYYSIYGYCKQCTEIPLKIKFILNLVSVIGGIFAVVYRLFFINNQTNLDFSLKDRIILITLISSFSVILVIGQFNKKHVKLMFYSLIAIIVGANSLFVLKYNWMNQTYLDKEAMTDLNDRVGDGYVLGEYINGFTLYNDLKPILHAQETLLKYMQDSHELYYFDYSDYNTYNLDEDHLNNYVEKEIQYPRLFQTFGMCREMALFKWKE